MISGMATAFNINEKVVCRICLKVLDPTKNSFGFVMDKIGTLREMIMNCVPEMDIYVSPNPIVCFPCIQTLVSLHLFKTKCINTETKIRTHVKRKDLPADTQVDLMNVVTEMVTSGEHDGTAITQQGLDTTRQSLESFTATSLNVRVVSNPSTARRSPCVTPLATTHRPNILRTYPSPAKGSTPTPFKGSVEEFPRLRSILCPKGESKRLHHPYLPIMSNVGGKFKDPPAPPIEKPVEPLIVDLCDLDDPEEPKKADKTTAQEKVKETPQEKVKETPPKFKVHPIEQKMRLVVKIPRCLIHVPKETKDESKKSDDDNDVQMSDGATGVIAKKPSEEQGSQDGDATETSQTPDTFHHERYLSCPYCSYVTNRLYGLNKHINTIHTKSVWYSCELCSYQTTDSSSLRRHSKTVHRHTVKNLECKICGEKFENNGILRKHVTKHKSVEFKCQFCSYSTKDRSNFRKHIFTHYPTSTQCDFCDYKCNSPYLMRGHLKRLHNGVGIEDVDCRGEVPLNKLLVDITSAREEASKF